MKKKGKTLANFPERYAKDFIHEMDGRVRVVKTIREDLDALYAALGGKENVSYMEQTLCQKVIYLKWLTGKKEAAMIHGGSIDETSYLNAVNCLSGLLTKIGLKRRAKQISLKDYLSNKPEPQPAPQPKEAHHGN
jgi:hypothetical protein